ncbi:MAG TPA: hypothetical protein PKI03_31555 [Pseudomonadota bacterium]|nr:hypothetical protein [Pseudomonadota bacterium]
MKKLYAALFSAALATGMAVPHALSHSTGRESRTVRDCEKLPSPERSQCLACVTRPLKHHYHPDYPAGARCRPDNGKP